MLLRFTVLILLDHRVLLNSVSFCRFEVRSQQGRSTGKRVVVRRRSVDIRYATAASSNWVAQVPVVSGGMAKPRG